MSILRTVTSICLLRWSLGLVVLWESYRFAISTVSVHHVEGMSLAPWIAPALGGIEIAAAVLHILHRQFEIGPLVVYSAAVLVCLSPGASHSEEALS